MPGAHATYAPSSAKRWMNCTASADAIATLGLSGEDEPDSPSAQGTEAHHEIDRLLGHLNGQIKPPNFYECIPPANPNHPAAYGIGLVLNFISQLPPGRLWIEQRVRLTDDIWGRCDVSHWSEHDGVLTILDYKNGFVPVDPETEQLMIYGASIIFTQHLVNVRWIRFVIVQPNDWRPVPRVKQIVMSAAELHAIATKAAAVPAGPKSFTAGTHCRYCPLFGRCKATNDLLVHLAIALQHPADKIPPHMIEPLMVCKKPLEDFFKSVEKQAVKSMLGGTVVDGMKVVRGDKHRDWRDPIAARAAVIEKLGVDALKVPSPAQAEDLGMDVSTLAFKPEGGPALAFDSDKRKPFAQKSAAEMFAGVLSEVKG